MAVNSRVSRVIRQEHPPLLVGVAVAGLSVAAITALIFPLRQVSQASSNGVLYLLAVLLVSDGLGAAARASRRASPSAVAFNFFHLPPTGRFTIADGRNWVALATFLVAAIVASAVAELARSRASEAEQRRREADLAADLARIAARRRASRDDARGRCAAPRGRARARVGEDPARRADEPRRRARLRAASRCRAGRHAGRSRRSVRADA